MDLYSSGDVYSKPAERAVGQVREKMRDRIGSFLGGSETAMRGIAKQGSLTADMIGNSIQTFGAANMLKGADFFGGAVKQIDIELDQSRMASAEARKQNDIQLYQAETRRRARLLDMKNQASLLDRQMFGQVFTGIASAFAMVLGTMLAGPAAAGLTEVTGASHGSVNLPWSWAH